MKLIGDYMRTTFEITDAELLDKLAILTTSKITSITPSLKGGWEITIEKQIKED